MEKIFENFVLSILKINKLIQKIKQYEMREFDLKIVHVMCLYYLYEHSEGLTSSELMRLTYEDKAAISRALKLLREKGFVEYDFDAYNAPVRLTENGEKVAEITIKKTDLAVEAGKAEFSEEERLFFYESLGKIADNLQKYYESLSNQTDGEQ